MTAIVPDNFTETLKDIYARLGKIEDSLNDLRVEVAEIKGRVSQLPTTWLMLAAIVATVFTVTATTAGILFAALNYAKTL